MASSSNNSPAAAAARKRRIELRNLQRSGKDDDLSLSDAKRPRVEEEAQVDPVTSKPKPHITGIKLQHRYDPGVKMSRHELKEWRKEARRVRNRESAAASRKRNRERITELESEVAALNTKYAAALKRILELEAGTTSESFTPLNLRQDIQELARGSFRSSTPVDEPVKTVSPPMSPATTMNHVSELDLNDEVVYQKHYHIMDMISRPAAPT